MAATDNSVSKNLDLLLGVVIVLQFIIVMRTTDEIADASLEVLAVTSIAAFVLLVARYLYRRKLRHNERMQELEERTRQEALLSAPEPEYSDILKRIENLEAIVTSEAD